MRVGEQRHGSSRPPSHSLRSRGPRHPRERTRKPSWPGCASRDGRRRGPRRPPVALSSRSAQRPGRQARSVPARPGPARASRTDPARRRCRPSSLPQAAARRCARPAGIRAATPPPARRPRPARRRPCPRRHRGPRRPRASGSPSTSRSCARCTNRPRATAVPRSRPRRCPRSGRPARVPQSEPVRRFHRRLRGARRSAVPARESWMSLLPFQTTSRRRKISTARMIRQAA